MNISTWRTVHIAFLLSFFPILSLCDGVQSGCPETTSDREKCYRCCVGNIMAMARSVDLEKEKLNAAKFCKERNPSEGDLILGELHLAQQKAVMSDDIAARYCRTKKKKQVRTEFTSNEDLCIRRCRQHIFGTNK